MTRNELILRLGYYAGAMYRFLKDDSYTFRNRGRVEKLSEQNMIQQLVEMQEKLVAGGFLKPEDDPYAQDPFMQSLRKLVE